MYLPYYVFWKYLVLNGGYVCDNEPVELPQVREQQVSKKDTSKPKDPRDETVRGVLPIFKLRSKEDRKEWKKMVGDLLFSNTWNNVSNKCVSRYS